MQEPATLMGHIMNQTPLLVVWVTWLMIVNTASVLFLRRHVEARWVLGAWVVNFGLMSALFAAFGFTRILGLAHVLVWTPLLVYLWRRSPGARGGSLFAAWIVTLFVSNAISVIIDYVDVARFLLGDGHLPP
jgi:hypothetical protein